MNNDILQSMLEQTCGYLEQEKSNKNSAKLIVKGSIYLVHHIALYEVYESIYEKIHRQALKAHQKDAAVNIKPPLPILIQEDFPQIVEKIIVTEGFSALIDSLPKNNEEACITFSFYRNISQISWHTQNTLKSYDLSLHGIDPRLKRVFKSVHKTGVLYSLLPSIFNHLDSIYVGGCHALTERKCELDRQKNKSRKK